MGRHLYTAVVVFPTILLPSSMLSNAVKPIVYQLQPILKGRSLQINSIEFCRVSCLRDEVGATGEANNVCD